jgi:uncharacterized protein with GYD domain
MPRYMLQFSYTAQAWAALAKNPASRRQMVEAMMQKLGGRLVDRYYHFGEFDGTAIVEAPDDTTAVAARSPPFRRDISRRPARRG